RYFSLLEAWLLVGRPEMIGERGGGMGRDYLMDCLTAWRFVPAKGLKFDLRRPQEGRYSLLARHLFHVALMDLFGLMEVVLPASPMQPWSPAAVKHRPFGDAVFTLLWQASYGTEALALLLRQEEGADPFGLLQPIFQPYFSAWKKKLVLPEPETRDG